VVLRRALTGIALGLALAGAFVIGQNSAPNPPRLVLGPTTAMPDLVGLPTSEALCRLYALGPRWRIHGSRPTRKLALNLCDGTALRQPDPEVINQAPAPGAPLDPRSVVEISTTCTPQRRCL
jgi:hypothetical protein